MTVIISERGTPFLAFVPCSPRHALVALHWRCLAWPQSRRKPCASLLGMPLTTMGYVPHTHTKKKKRKKNHNRKARHIVIRGSARLPTYLGQSSFLYTIERIRKEQCRCCVAIGLYLVASAYINGTVIHELIRKRELMCPILNQNLQI